MTHKLENLLTRFAMRLFGAAGVTQADAGIPEPPVISYGTIARAGSGTPLVPATVVWIISGNGESVAVATTLVTVNGTPGERIASSDPPISRQIRG